MSFKTAYRRAVDPAKPLGSRFIYLRTLVNRYCATTGKPYPEVWDWLDLESRPRMSGEEMTDVADLLRAMREAYLLMNPVRPPRTS